MTKRRIADKDLAWFENNIANVVGSLETLKRMAQRAYHDRDEVLLMEIHSIGKRQESLRRALIGAMNEAKARAADGRRDST